MSISSIIFMVLFLPLALGVYFLMPHIRLKNLVLVLASLVFYAWGSPRGMVLLLLSIVFNYFAGLAIWNLVDGGNARKRAAARLLLTFAVIVDLAVLVIYKYVKGALPLGISFYTFTVLSYLFDVYREQEEAAGNPLDLALYVSFFPKLVAGPIVKYRDMKSQIRKRRSTKEGLAEGFELFLVGLFKKVLIADYLGASFGQIRALPQISAATAILATVFYALQLYFDFSGYSDMAIGLACVFGFRFEKNFNYPYISMNISEFWRRWHISLGSWFREYVYIPLGGNRNGDFATFRNLLVVWALTGIWHGSSLNFLIWGLWHGAFIILERFVIRDRLDRAPRILRIILTDAVVTFGWCFFFTNSLSDSFSWIGKIFGGDGLGFADATFGYFLRTNLIVLVIAVLACSPLIRGIQTEFSRRGMKYRVALTTAVYALLFAFCVASLIGSTNTTFLYAKF